MITDARLWHPWLRVQRVLREILAMRPSAEALREVESEIKQVLAVRDDVRRAGWFN